MLPAWTPELWARALSIVLIDLALAGDNALVIALAVRSLPREQQVRGQIWGALGAVVLRLLFIVAVTLLLKIPLLQLAGGLVLVWIAVRLVQQESGVRRHVRAGASLVQAVWIIAAADAVMSLDNVLAVAAAARGHLSLVVIGIALSLPLVVWGSGVLARLMRGRAWIVWLAGGVLGYVSGEMMLADPLVAAQIAQPAAGWLRRAVPLLLGIGLFILGWRMGASASSDKPTAEAPS